MALTVFLAVCFLHFWKLGTAPRGFYVDEASIAYNAYCIALTGADENGTSRPMFFRSVDTYVNPVSVYSEVLPIRAFGLEKWAARLPCALYSLLACVAFSLLLRHWRFEAPLALAGGFLLAVIPWAFPLSRSGGAGYTAPVLGLVTGLALTGSALRRRSNWRAVLAGAMWALTFYMHQSFQPVLALLAIGCVVVLWRPLVQRWRLVSVMALSALIVLLPLIISIQRSPVGLTARFHQVSVASGAMSLRDLMVSVTTRYLDYFSPRFLFITGDQQLRHHTGHGGELYWCLAPLILTGLYVAIRYWRQNALHRIVLVGILVSPVSAALTVDRMHSIRCVYAVIFWLLLAVLGASVLWRHRPVGRKLLLVICAAGLVETATYLADYFGPYQTRCHGAFQTGFTDALDYCFSHIGSNQTLYVSGSVGVDGGAFINTDFKSFVYAHLLFYGKIDPWTYQHGGFSNTIIRPYLEEIDRPGLLLRCNYTPTQIVISEGRQISAIPNFESISDAAKLLVAFRDDPFVYQVWEVRTTPQAGVTHNNPRIALKHAGTFRYPDAETHCYLGVVLQRAGKIQKAIEQYEQALRIWPDYAEAHYNLGVCREKTGQVREGIAQYEDALRLKPDLIAAQNDLAWSLATHTPAEGGDPVRAVALAQEVGERAGTGLPTYLDTLAAAYAAAGRFSDAIATAEKAIDLARAGGQPDLAARIEARLELYRRGQAYRQSVGETGTHTP
jgi:hypothetical protein